MDYIYAKLNESVEKVEYTGTTSSTIEVVVDQDKRTISAGVIAITPDLLLATQVPVPGNYFLKKTIDNSTIKYEWASLDDIIDSISKLDEAVATEVANRIAQDEAIRKALGDEVTRLDNLLLQTERDLQNEIIENRNGLEILINNETDAREEADRALQASVDKNSQDIADISASLTNTSEGFQRLLNEEAEKRANKDNQLDARIDAENEARVAADVAINAAIDNLTANTAEQIEAAVAAEASERKAADEQLQTNIDTVNTQLTESINILKGDLTAETETREKDIQAVQESLGKETKARTDADTQLQENINTVSTKLDSVIDGSTPVQNAKNVTDTIASHPINDIFESDGVTAKNATAAQRDGSGNIIASTYTPATAFDSTVANINASISSLNNNLSSNVSSLDTKINAEANAREKAISSLDTTLSTKINAVDARVNDTNDRIDVIVSEMSTHVGVTGQQTITGSLTLSKDENSSENTGNLYVDGETHLEGTLQVDQDAHFGQDVYVEGDLHVTGTTTTSTAETLNVEDQLIVTNANGTELTGKSGLAIKTGANNSTTAAYGIVYDNANDAVLLGEGNLNSTNDFEFNSGEGYPIAIRDYNTRFEERAIPVYTNDGKKFIDSNITINNNILANVKGFDGLTLPTGTTGVIATVANVETEADRATQAESDLQANINDVQSNLTDHIAAIADTSNYGHVRVDTTPAASSSNAVSSGGVYTELGKKVDKVDGKQLSTEDFTTALKNKLDGIADNANNYVLPSEVVKSVAGMTGPTVSLKTLTFTGAVTGSYNGASACTISIPTVAGPVGPTGANGYTWIPNVATNGHISWTSSQAGAGTTPTARNIMGPTGPAGNDGAPGATPNITIGTVTTGAAGSTAGASITGTTPNLILNLTIPRGADGQDGQDGQDGAPGAAAGFGTPTVKTTTGAPGSQASVTVTANSSSPNTARVFDFAFTIPQGPTGPTGSISAYKRPVTYRKTNGSTGTVNIYVDSNITDFSGFAIDDGEL